MATRSEVFSLLTCRDATTFLLLSVFTLTETINLKVCAKPLPMNAKRPLPVHVCRSKTPLLKLPIPYTIYLEVTVIRDAQGRIQQQMGLKLVVLNDILKSFSVFEYKFCNNIELNVTSNKPVTHVNQNVQTEKIKDLVGHF